MTIFFVVKIERKQRKEWIEYNTPASKTSSADPWEKTRKFFGESVSMKRWFVPGSIQTWSFSYRGLQKLEK